jgi:hypothetical protein
MDSKHAEHLKEGTRVAVPMGQAVGDLYGYPPIVTTGTVLGLAENDRWWVHVDIAQGETLPQMYAIEEIIGLMMPMAVVTHHPDGSTTGVIPLR